MKRSPLRRNSHLERRLQLQTKSVKRRREEPLWSRLRDSVLRRDSGTCQTRGIAPGPCWGPVSVHHVLPVGRGGSRLAPAESLVSVCAACHRYIHEHPAWAEEVGLLRRS